MRVPFKPTASGAEAELSSRAPRFGKASATAACGSFVLRLVPCYLLPTSLTHCTPSVRPAASAPRPNGVRAAMASNLRSSVSRFLIMSSGLNKSCHFASYMAPFHCHRCHLGLCVAHNRVHQLEELVGPQLLPCSLLSSERRLSFCPMPSQQALEAEIRIFKDIVLSSRKFDANGECAASQVLHPPASPAAHSSLR